MQKLAVTIEMYPAVPNTHIIYFKGDFDGSVKENVASLESFVLGASPKTNLILDFADLTYLNSYAIGYLMTWHNHLEPLGGNIAVVGAHKSVLEIFEVLGLTGVFKNYATIEDAAKDLK